MRLLSTLLLLAALAAPARAQELNVFRHKVEAGDTMELLAAEYYGNRKHAVFLMKANNMTHPEKLRPGRRLKIPRQLEIIANVGDTLEGFAEQYMGDARRAPFLAEFNNLPAGASIAAGQTIVIPFHFKHTAQARETLTIVAATYLHDGRKADLLKGYNFIDVDELERGESIVVPIYNVRVRPGRMPERDAASVEREARLREMEEKAILALPTARTAWRAGDYDVVKRALVEIDLAYLPTELVVEVGVLLGAAYVAFGDNDSAMATFEQVLRRAPGHALRAYDFSPTIQAVWTKAGGSVEKGR